MDELLGDVGNFPAPYDGAPRFYWRSWLRGRLTAIDPMFAYPVNRRKDMQHDWLEHARRIVRESGE